MKSRTLPLLFITLLLYFLQCGCVDNAQQTASLSAKLESSEKHSQQLLSQLESEKQEHTRTKKHNEMKQARLDEDLQVAVFISISMSVAMLILILLIARERRLRRVLEKLFHHLLECINDSRNTL